MSKALRYVEDALGELLEGFADVVHRDDDHLRLRHGDLPARRPPYHRLTARRLVGQASRLRQAIAAAEAQRPLRRLAKADAMTHRYVDGRDAGSCAQDQAQELRPVAQL